MISADRLLGNSGHVPSVPASEKSNLQKAGCPGSSSAVSEHPRQEVITPDRLPNDGPELRCVPSKNIENTFWQASGPAFSSKSDDWATPPDVFARLDAEFSFELDVCASKANAKCERFFTVFEDGLAQEWTGTVWMNPPYGRGIGAWLKKAADSAEAGATVVCLIPARTDTTWWHEQVMTRASEVRFVRGRLSFGAAKAPAPFPSAIVVYRPQQSSLAVTTWTPSRKQAHLGAESPCPSKTSHFRGAMANQTSSDPPSASTGRQHHVVGNRRLEHREVTR